MCLFFIGSVPKGRLPKVVAFIHSSSQLLYLLLFKTEFGIATAVFSSIIKAKMKLNETFNVNVNQGVFQISVLRRSIIISYFEKGTYKLFLFEIYIEILTRPD